VKWFNNEKGYGFISRASGGMYSFITPQSSGGFRSLNEGDKIEFDVVRAQGSAGPERNQALAPCRSEFRHARNLRASHFTPRFMPAWRFRRATPVSARCGPATKGLASHFGSSTCAQSNSSMPAINFLPVGPIERHECSRISPHRPAESVVARPFTLSRALARSVR